MAIKAHIKGNTLFIEVPCNTTNPRPSSKGITLLVASASETTDIEVLGKPLKISLNAMIKA